MNPRIEIQKAPALFEEFQIEMARLSGRAELISKENIAERVLSELSEWSAANVCGFQGKPVAGLELKRVLDMPDVPDIHWLPERPSPGLDIKAHMNTLAAADLAITTCDYLVADTATLVFSSKTHPSRMLTLLPPVILVITSLETLLPNLAALYKQSDISEVQRQSSLVFFTGPSRTADIEKKLVLGVHGPKALTVLVVDE